MVAGTWYNQDGLYLQFGTQKPVPEIGGDYLVYGEMREIEQFIPLVPVTFSSSTAFTVGAAPITFSGTGTALQAGIQSINTLVPLQVTAVNAGGTTITLVAPQLFFEQTEIDTIIAATGGTSLNIGLATTSQLPGAPNATFVQVTPNTGVQLLDTMLIANMTPAGKKVTWNLPGATGISSGTAANNTIAGGGAWLGNVPLVTNAITPLPQSAWISTIATGAFTNGLLKFRLKYTMYGNINY